MTATQTTTGTYQGKTADEYRAASAEALARREESYERSDTDGYVTQFVHGLTSQENSLKARLAEQNGMTEIPALFDLDGNLVPAKHGWSDFGEYYRVVATGKFFNPSKARNQATARANNAKKGFYVGTVRVPAEVRTMGGGKGFSGLSSVYTGIVPVSDTTSPATAEIVDNGQN